MAKVIELRSGFEPSSLPTGRLSYYFVESTFRMSALSAAHGAVHTLYSNFFVTLPVPQARSDLPHQIFIVTGSNTGLGRETCRHLLKLGARKVIMAVRTISKGEAAKEELLSSTGRKSDSVEVWPLDMDSYESVKAFGRRASSLPRIDGVLANAGIMTSIYRTSEGQEQTLNVNVISTFLLFFVLLGKMRESEHQTGNACYFVIPNSALHYVASTAELNPKEDTLARLNDEKKANMAGRYALSKLLVVWIARELGDRCKGSPILNTPNPSLCQSDLFRDHEVGVAAKVLTKILARTTEEGSRTLYHGLFAGKESNGQYLTNCKIHGYVCT
jgi:NAD(P)-dependent dehydrogenase (short-subunit alcohol dehydrogenase family)